MTTGEKIRRIRCHRKMTQKELGERIGLGEGGANRIAQYEMGYRVPKKPLLDKMTEAFGISPCALREPQTDLSGVMETLLWLDEEHAGVLQFTTMEFDSPDRWQEDEVAYDDRELRGNLTIPCSVFPPTVLWTQNGMLDGFFKEWGRMQAAYLRREISREEYFEWKLQWPTDERIRALI